MSVEERMQEAVGRPFWNPTDLANYKARQLAQLGIFAKFRIKVEAHLNYLGIDGFGEYLADVLAGLEIGKIRWNKVFLEYDNRFFRNWDFEEVPPEVLEVVSRIRTFFPKARLSIEFLGADPILHVEIDEGDTTYYFVPLVWDKDKKGRTIIVPPPV